jgi:ketosteroid isomerase-like protein
VSEPEERGNDVVSRFWRAVHEHDWAALETCLAEDFVRVGMRDDDEDTCVGRDAYLAFVSGLIGRFDHHELRTVRVYWSEDRRHAVSEAIETITPPGEEPLAMRFANLHEIDEDGLISRLDIFWKSPPRRPPDWITVDAVLDRED